MPGAIVLEKGPVSEKLKNENKIYQCQRILHYIIMIHMRQVYRCFDTETLCIIIIATANLTHFTSQKFKETDDKLLNQI